MQFFVCGARPKLEKFDQSKSFIDKHIKLSNFANFGLVPQAQFLIYIFFIVALCDCNQKRKTLYGQFSKWRALLWLKDILYLNSR